MIKRLAVPGIFLIGVGAIFGQALAVFFPIFFQVVMEPHAPGQAMRAALYWISTHLLIPLGGAIVGVFVAEFIQKRKAGSPHPRLPPQGGKEKQR